MFESRINWVIAVNYACEHEKKGNTIPAGYKYMCLHDAGRCGWGNREYVGESLEAGASPAWFQVKVILFNSDEWTEAQVLLSVHSGPLISPFFN